MLTQHVVEDMVHVVEMVALPVAEMQIWDKYSFTKQNTFECRKHGLRKVVLTTRHEPIIFFLLKS